MINIILAGNLRINLLTIKCVKSFKVKNEVTDVILMSLLLTLNRSITFSVSLLLTLKNQMLAGKIT